VSILNRGELITAATSWLKRTDLVGNIPDLIQLAEARHKRDLRVRQMETYFSISTVADDPSVALPAGWLEFDSIVVRDVPRSLDYLPPNQLRERYTGINSGTPRFYTVDGSGLRLGPTPAGVYTIEGTYFQAPTSIAEGLTTATNWLLTEYPMIYLAAVLAEGFALAVNDQRATFWDGKYTAEVEQLKTADRNARTSGAGLRQRAR
jgi:hypothetical protein